MMKRILFSMMLAVTLIFIGSQTNQVQAYSQYVGTFSDGHNAYLIVDTIKKFNVGRAGAYECTVRAVKGSSSFYIYYRFEADDRGWNYRNSQGFSGYVTSRTPVTQNILTYILNGV